MQFAYPAAFAGLASIPLLFLLNLWKYRRLRVTVGSLIVWKRLSRHAEPPPSSKHRFFNLSLLMQIIVILCLTTAIAGPRIRHSTAAGRTFHIVIDRSASTNASSSGSRVFERITLSASALLNKISEADLVYCHAFPGLSGLETAGPHRRDEALSWLSLLRPTGLAGDAARAALQVAARAEQDDGQVFLFTDHTVTGIPTSVRVCQSPADTGNLAIIAARPAIDSDTLRIFFRIANFSPDQHPAPWVVTGTSGRRYLSSEENAADLPPGGNTAVSRALPPEARSEKTIELRLLESDALAADNAAYFFRRPTADLKISYIGRQDPRLVRVLSALPGAVVTLAETPEPGCNLAVFNETSPEKLPGCGAVVIAPLKGIPGLLTAAGGTYVPKGPFVAAESDLTPNPQWAEKITIGKALNAITLRHVGASVILEGNGPLIVDFTLEGRRIVYIGFALADTNWHNQVSFPLFWGLLAEQAGASESEWISRTTGSSVSLPSRGMKSIASPSGEMFTPSHQGPRTLFQPESVGLYRADYADGEVLFGASLLSPAESRLSGEDISFKALWLDPDGKREFVAATWLWQYFAFLGAFAMLASWLLWRERKKD